MNALQENQSTSEELMVSLIKEKREQMIQSANKYGFTNEQTVRYSQELDELINVYNSNHTPTPATEVRIVYNHMIMVFQKMFATI
ncbi:hypothetical protein GCM10008967_13730 [Bacillus carboniphilus]|uniref:Aspartyl-phosphate phosphatase Spo0E family protein n=1 Tax=Bacillus carboniphilus TaxID=86663 RepID=A0ABN0W4M6_9BACI